MTSNPDESPDSPGKPSPARPSSASSRDWVLVTANVLFVVAFVPIAMMLYELLHTNEDTDFVGVGNRVYFCMGAVFCFATISAVLFGVRQYKLQVGTIFEPSRISDASLSSEPSLDELQKKGGMKRLFVWLWDCVSMIAVVFCFALGACMKCNTQPLFAAVFLTFAVLYPSMAKRTHRQREVLFGEPSKDESRRSSP